MLLRSLATSSILLFSLTLSGAALSRSHRGPTAQRSYSKHASHMASKVSGQRTIEDSRASEIQQALVGAGYLSEEPTGHWDSETQAAMQRYQADHGWQTKLTPDSRAIIKLGLGPHASSDMASEASIVEAQ